MVVVDGGREETRFSYNLMVQGFPTVVRVGGGGGEAKPVKYVGRRQVDDLVDWVVRMTDVAPAPLGTVRTAATVEVGESSAELWCTRAANLVALVWLIALVRARRAGRARAETHA